MEKRDRDTAPEKIVSVIEKCLSELNVTERIESEKAFFELVETLRNCAKSEASPQQPGC